MTERVDRASAIMGVLSDTGSASVADLAQDLGVSEVTIRGDLRKLEQQGKLVRTHGGARPLGHKTILQRERIRVEEKQRIAAAAAAMLTDDDAVMIEAGTTAAQIVKHLTGRLGVQVVTNSALVFAHARANPALNVILSGGVFRHESESFVGPIAERTVGEFNARIAFLGTDGFSAERGLTTRFVEGAQVSNIMRDRAEETWLVADSSKFGQAGFVSFMPLARITGIITDSGLTDEAAASLSEHTRLRIV